MKFSLVQRKMYINSQLLILKLSLEKKYIREFLNLFISLHPVFAGQLFLLFTTSPYKSKKCQLNDIMYLSYLRECIENRTWLRIQAGKFRATMIQHFTVSFLKRESMMQTFILFLLFILYKLLHSTIVSQKKKKNGAINGLVSFFIGGCFSHCYLLYFIFLLKLFNSTTFSHFHTPSAFALPKYGNINTSFSYCIWFASLILNLLRPIWILCQLPNIQRSFEIGWHLAIVVTFLNPHSASVKKKKKRKQPKLLHFAKSSFKL